MNNFRIALVLLLFCSGVVFAKLGEAESVSATPPLEVASPAEPIPTPTNGTRYVPGTYLAPKQEVHPLSLAVGPSFIVGAESMAAASLNARYHRERLSIELGGQWPATVSTHFRRVQQTVGAVVYDAHIVSLAEIHLAAHYEFLHRSPFITPDVGFGVSMLQIQNEIQASTPTGFSRSKTSETSWSPLARLGVRFFPKSRVSFLIDLAYVYYANKPHHSGAGFSLPVEGLMVRPMVQMRI